METSYTESSEDVLNPVSVYDILSILPEYLKSMNNV